MAGGTVISRIVGLAREQIMAYTFGASGYTDVFVIAFRISNIFRDLMGEGVLASSLIPVLSEAKVKGDREVRKVLWSFFIAIFIVDLILVLLTMIFAREIVIMMTNQKFIASDYFELAVTLTRFMAPFLIIISMAAISMVALNFIKIFFIPSLAPAFFNLVMIISMLTLAPILQRNGIEPIFSLAFGVIFGGLVQFIIQFILVIFKRAIAPTSSLSIFSRSTKKVFSKLGAGAFSVVTNQLNMIVVTILATGTQVAAVSWLNYAYRLFQFPLGVLGVSTANANLVYFNTHYKNGDIKKALEFLKSSFNVMSMVVIPALALILALSFESIHILFERGAFNREDSILTAQALNLYIIGLPFFCAYKIFLSVFFSIDKQHIPIIISAISTAFSIIFSITLVDNYGFSILALGVSLAMIINCLSQGIILTFKLNLPWSFFINLKLVKFILGAITCFFITSFVRDELFLLSSLFIEKLGVFLLSSLVGIICYVLVLAILGELSILRRNP